MEDQWNRVLYICNISANTQTIDLKMYFHEFGTVSDVVIIETKDSMRFGLVKMATEAQGHEAISFKRHYICSAYVTVRGATKNEKELLQIVSNRQVGFSTYPSGCNDATDKRSGVLFIGEISDNTHTTDLRMCFRAWGTVNETVIIETEDSKRFGFVEMATKSQADEALGYKYFYGNIGIIRGATKSEKELFHCILNRQIELG